MIAKIEAHLLGNLEDRLQWADFEHECRADYSGRGMYGDTCIGWVTDYPHKLMLQIGIWIGQLEGDPNFPQDVVDAFMDPRTDNMGRDYIVYFPKLQMAPQFETNVDVHPRSYER